MIMGIEQWMISESEKKKKELSEKKLKDWIKKQIEFKKTKEKIWVEIKAEDDIFHLKELIEKWILTHETAKKIVDWEHIDDKSVKEIFNKIDELEDIKDINKYIPKELRITHDEYSKALHDDIFRVQTITKLDSALTLIANQINPDSAIWLNLFSWFLTVLDKNLIKVQENTIDVKDSLKEIDEKKFWKTDKRTLWQKFIDFLKEIFSN